MDSKSLVRVVGIYAGTRKVLKVNTSSLLSETIELFAKTFNIETMTDLKLWHIKLRAWIEDPSSIMLEDEIEIKVYNPNSEARVGSQLQREPLSGVNPN